MANLNENMRTSAQKFLQQMHDGRSARKTREFLRSGELELDRSLQMKFDGDSFWAEGKNRAIGRLVNGWFFARQWYWAKDLLEENEKNHLGIKIGELYKSWIKSTGVKGSMAYHDETTARRVLHLALILDAFEPWIASDVVVEMRENHSAEIELLSTSWFHDEGTNHGMFQDIAILVACAYSPSLKNGKFFRAIAIERLIKYFKSSFTTDGIHLENSPTYHLLVSGYLAAFIHYLQYSEEQGVGKDLEIILEKADLYAAFCITPQGSFVPVSDTNTRKLSPERLKEVFGESFSLGSRSGGAMGKIPEINSLVSKPAGYAIYRDSWKSAYGAYLYFSASCNSDFHKHSDELSFLYQVDGRNIITEAGPYGYEYENPLTKYGYSSFAHNTLIVDDEGLPRTGGDDSSTEIISNELIDKDVFRVSGRTRRFHEVEWTRTLEIELTSASRILRVVDRIKSQSSHKYTFLWHLDKEAKARLISEGFQIIDQEGKVYCNVSYFSNQESKIRIMNGQLMPRVQGWIFPVMHEAVPSDVIEFDIEGSDCEIVWEFKTKIHQS